MCDISKTPKDLSGESSDCTLSYSPSLSEESADEWKTEMVKTAVEKSSTHSMKQRTPRKKILKPGREHYRPADLKRQSRLGPYRTDRPQVGCSTQQTFTRTYSKSRSGLGVVQPPLIRSAVVDEGSVHALLTVAEQVPNLSPVTSTGTTRETDDRVLPKGPAVDITELMQTDSEVEIVRMLDIPSQESSHVTTGTELGETLGHRVQRLIDSGNIFNRPPSSDEWPKANRISSFDTFSVCLSRLERLVSDDTRTPVLDSCLKEYRFKTFLRSRLDDTRNIVKHLTDDCNAVPESAESYLQFYVNSWKNFELAKSMIDVDEKYETFLSNKTDEYSFLSVDLTTSTDGQDQLLGKFYQHEIDELAYRTKFTSTTCLLDVVNEELAYLLEEGERLKFRRKLLKKINDSMAGATRDKRTGGEKSGDRVRCLKTWRNIVSDRDQPPYYLFTFHGSSVRKKAVSSAAEHQPGSASDTLSAFGNYYQSCSPNENTVYAGSEGLDEGLVGWVRDHCNKAEDKYKIANTSSVASFPPILRQEFCEIDRFSSQPTVELLPSSDSTCAPSEIAQLV